MGGHRVASACESRDVLTNPPAANIAILKVPKSTQFAALSQESEFGMGKD